MERRFILACSKPWGDIALRHLAKTAPGEWRLVESNEGLERETRFDLESIFFLHWNWKIPPEIYSTFRCIGFHMTDLPFGRGGSPLQNLIVRGFNTTKLTAFRIFEEMDAGPILIKRELDLLGRAEEIYIRSALLACEMIKEIIEGNVKEYDQTGVPVFFKRRRPSESEISTFDTMIDLYNHMRMLDAPTYPNAFLRIGRFKFEFSNVVRTENSIEASVHISDDVLD